MAVIHKETVAFIEAAEYLKSNSGVTYKALEEAMNFTKGTFSMIKLGRRKIRGLEVKEFIRVFPEISTFFDSKSQSAKPQVVNEPPTDYKKADMFQYLLNSSIKANEALIELQAAEIERLKAEVQKLEAELDKNK